MQPRGMTVSHVIVSYLAPPHPGPLAPILTPHMSPPPHPGIPAPHPDPTHEPPPTPRSPGAPS